MPQLNILIIHVVCIASHLTAFPFAVKNQDLDSLFTRICAEEGVSKELAMAIAKTESGLNPLAINVAGMAHQPRSREEAEAIIQQACAAGQSYDVGLMQINRCWINKWGVKPESLLDPETNIRAGLKILAGEISRFGFSWEAVGAYHSPSPDRRKRYAWSVYNQARPQKGGAVSGGRNGQQKARDKGILLYRRNQSHH